MKTLIRIHQDEDGLEALQVVMIIAVAAICLALIKLFWPNIQKWFKKEVDNITDMDGADGNKEGNKLVDPPPAINP